MAHRIRRVGYFYITVKDHLGTAYDLLNQLADLGVNLLAFTSVPIGPLHTQLTLFPESNEKLVDAADMSGLTLDGPHPALLVQGDDELGALASIHARLAEANVDVYASTGVSDGKGSYGYLVYVRPDEFERAASTLAV